MQLMLLCAINGNDIVFILFDYVHTLSGTFGLYKIEGDCWRILMLFDWLSSDRYWMLSTFIFSNATRLNFDSN